MELRDLYNSKRILTGEVIQKGQDAPLGSYYITVVVFIENNNGEFLLQKRVMNKDAKWATREEIEKLIEDDKFSKSHEEFYRYCLEFLEI